MPIFSLPGRYGTWQLRKEAYRFADSLKEAGAELLADPSSGTYELWGFALPVLFYLCGQSVFYRSGQLSEEILPRRIKAKYDFGKDEHRIDYGKLYEGRLELLYHAYQVENYCGIEGISGF